MTGNDKIDIPQRSLLLACIEQGAIQMYEQGSNLKFRVRVPAQKFAIYGTDAPPGSSRLFVHSAEHYCEVSVPIEAVVVSNYRGSGQPMVAISNRPDRGSAAETGIGDLSCFAPSQTSDRVN